MSCDIRIVGLKDEKDIERLLEMRAAMRAAGVDPRESATLLRELVDQNGDSLIDMPDQIARDEVAQVDIDEVMTGDVMNCETGLVIHIRKTPGRDRSYTRESGGMMLKIIMHFSCGGCLETVDVEAEARREFTSFSGRGYGGLTSKRSPRRGGGRSIPTLMSLTARVVGRRFVRGSNSYDQC